MSFPFRSHFPNGLIHGCDYNPEQWLHQPDILSRDIELMQEAGINLVSIGIFSWSHLEPKNGKYDFAWMDACFDRLHAAGIRVCLATATAAVPLWLIHQHPETILTPRSGVKTVFGRRHNFCCSSPVYREKSRALIERLSERYGNHPALFAWHVNNEYGGAEDGARCYCPGCISAFQDWLKERYDHSLDKLNLAWWTSFWSHRYSAWSEIFPRDNSIDALSANWFRFTAWQKEDFLQHEIQAIRSHSTAPVTTNLHGDGCYANDGLLARHLDFVSYDSYPDAYGTPADLESFYGAAFHADRMRGLKKQPWLLLESCPAQPQYKTPTRVKRPGIHRLLSLQQVAHGAEGICYFQWRAGRGGIEKLHGAICNWDAPEHTRVFAEVAELGKDLQTLTPVQESTQQASIALIWDLDAQWGFDLTNGLNRIPSPQQRAMRWYQILRQQQQEVDVLSLHADLEGYDLILIPGLFQINHGIGEKLIEAVRNGATLLADPLCGWVDEDLKMLPGGRLGPDLRNLFGISCEEVDCLRADESVPLQIESSSGLPDASQAVELCDLIRQEGAEVLSRFDGEFYTGRPQLTLNSYGKGQALYLASGLNDEALSALLAHHCNQLGIAPLLSAAPSHVDVTRRLGPDGQEFLFLLNLAPEACEIALDKKFNDLLDPQAASVSGTLRLPPHGLRILG